jgi:AraC-like DNA-binding protein
VIHEVFSPSVLVPELLGLYLESRSIDIAVETLTALLQPNSENLPAQALSRHDVIRLQRAKDFVSSDPLQELTLDGIAAAAAISNSGLQRLFRRAENCSVFEYVRASRLTQAKTSLQTGLMSIQEVSAAAGYKSAANFATAFRRKFGVSPSEVS